MFFNKPIKVVNLYPNIPFFTYISLVLVRSCDFVGYLPSSRASFLGILINAPSVPHTPDPSNQEGR